MGSGRTKCGMLQRLLCGLRCCIVVDYVELSRIKPIECVIPLRNNCCGYHDECGTVLVIPSDCFTFGCSRMDGVYRCHGLAAATITFVYASSPWGLFGTMDESGICRKVSKRMSLLPIGRK